MCWGAKQRIDIQLSKLRFAASVNVFVSRLVLAERKGDFVFNIMYGKFWFDGDFSFKIWTPAWSSVSTSRFHKGSPLSFLDRLVLSLFWQIGTLSFPFFLFFFLFFSFFFFFTNDFLPLLIFHKQRFFIKQKALTSEFCKVFDVSKIWQ